MSCSGLDCAFGLAWPFQHGGEAPDQIAHDARLSPRRAVGETLVLGRVADKADIVFPGVKLLHGVQPLGSINGATLLQAMGIDG